jgi:uncharacterized repeat protein (TIGR01451 family)
MTSYRSSRAAAGTFRLTALLACALVAPLAPADAAPGRQVPAASRVELPMRFEPNLGRTDAEVAYVARGAGYTVFLTPEETVLALRDGGALRMRLDGSRPPSQIAAEGKLPGSSSHFAGADPSRWAADIPGFERVRFSGVYPGVDAVYYGNDRSLEYDFVVAPNADPGAIGIALDGADEVVLGHDGALRLRVGGRDLVQHAPVSYQFVDGVRRPVASRYVLDGGLVRIAVGAYDASRELVIDPVLSYSSYLGGSGVDEALAIAVDGAGNTYVAGATSSLDFPRRGGLQTPSRASDAFVAKIAPDGASLVFSTIVGGSSEEKAYGLVLGSDGAIYLTGSTTSVDFPVVLGMSRRGAGADAFVVKLAASGAQILSSSAFGGGADDTARAIAVDATGAVYITGSTLSADFPTQLPIQVGSGGGNEDVFVSKIDPSGANFAYSTYLGGGARDVGLGIVVDSAGAVTVAGGTNSTTFPVRRAFQNQNAGARDGFVTTLVATGTEISTSTYIGGTFNDAVNGIALGPDGALYLTGQTFSDDFPTMESIQENAGGGDAFVTKLDATMAAIAYSTFLGGTGEDQANAIAVDPTGSAFVAGFTASTDYPTRLPLQVDTNDSANDAFVTKLNTLGNRIAYSTYLGGSGADRAEAIAVDASANAYVAGTTLSANFPVANPFGTDDDVEDGFVAKIGDAFADLSVTLAATPEPVRSNDLLTLTATVSNAGPDSAGNVTVSIATPAGTVFESATSTAGTCETPAQGAAGTVRCHVGTLASGESATLTLRVRVTANQGATIAATASVTSTVADTVPANDAASTTSSVIEPVDPPIVTSVSKLVVAGKPYRIRIDGANLQFGAQVFIGGSATPWPDVKYKNGTRIILKKGATLKAAFPKGVPVEIRIVNPDGGETTTSFTR